jgi:hypothetical protein
MEPDTPTPGRWMNMPRHYRKWRKVYQSPLTPMITLHHFSNPLWLEELEAGKIKRGEIFEDSSENV